MKSVIMMYPIRHFVERDRNIPGALVFKFSTIENVFTKRFKIGITRTQFRKRFKLINTLLDEYREKGFNVNWVYFSRTDNLSQPDLLAHHPIFEPREEDNKIAAGITYKNHRLKHEYPNPEDILKQARNTTELICGGFHKDDCVKRIVEYATQKGILAEIDPLLTEDFFFKMTMTFQEDMAAASLLADTFEEHQYEKRVAMLGRLDNYL